MNMQNELAVISKAKDLSRIVFEVTERSPKKFRFTLVSRMQNLTMDIIRNLYMANNTYIDLKIISDMSKTIDFTKDKKRFSSEEERLYYQNKLYSLKMNRAIKMNERVTMRLDHSYMALTCLRELDWIVTLSAETQCITAKQQERLAKLIYEEKRLIGGFIKSDKKRFNY